MENSRSIGPGSGWEPLYFTDDNQEGILFTFMKGHSYGEYIFDWEWARAYEQHGIPYYPKLTSMIPFTPATTSHFIMPVWNEKAALKLLQSYESFFKTYDFSSSHFLFLKNEEIALFEGQDYLIRESMQYHFFNEGYASFDDYLSRLKSKKAKNVRLERNNPNLTIERLTGKELTPFHAAEMYQFYLSTIDLKNAIDYLKEDFFQHLFTKMQGQIMYARARRGEKTIAGSLFFYDTEKLYGRYWGSSEYVENLHFELCYYQGIDFTLEQGLKVFEAGAQGEHKIPRGFKPVRTYSAHKFKHQAFHAAIGNFIQAEKEQISMMIETLSKQLPFRMNLKA